MLRNNIGSYPSTVSHVPKNTPKARVHQIVGKMNIDEFFTDPFEDATGGHNATTPEADLQALTRAWINERGAPEILP